MKTLFLSITLIISFISNAQTLDRDYSEDIYFGASKEDLIDLVLEKVNDYYLNDVNGILKKIKKEKGIKLNKLENRVGFISKMEMDIMNKLNATDNWGYDLSNSIYKEYFVSVQDLLGEDIEIPGFRKPNSGNNGKATVALGFKENSLSSLYVHMVTYKYRDVSNGAPYNNEYLKELSRVMNANFGDFTHERSYWSTSICSSREEPVYRERFNISGEGIMGYVEAEFSAYINQIDSYNCRVIGNQLTAVTLDLSQM